MSASDPVIPWSHLTDGGFAPLSRHCTLMTAKTETGTRPTPKPGGGRCRQRWNWRYRKREVLADERYRRT